jgi:hypothetical protein
LGAAISDAREDVAELERLADLAELEWIYTLLTGRAEKRRNQIAQYERQLRKLMMEVPR